MKFRFIKSSNVIISFFLSLLGFSTACDIITRAEYGTPHADFIINGSVKSADTNIGIPNIKVNAKWDSVYTNSEGDYQISFESFPEDQDIQIRFTDIDGDTDGEFQQLDTIVKFQNIEFEKERNWYYGEVEKEFDVKLNNGNDES